MVNVLDFLKTAPHNCSRIGKKSTRLVNAAAVKLSEELFNMISRPDYARITRVREGTESQVKIDKTNIFCVFLS